MWAKGKKTQEKNVKKKGKILHNRATKELSVLTMRQIGEKAIAADQVEKLANT